MKQAGVRRITQALMGVGICLLLIVAIAAAGAADPSKTPAAATADNLPPAKATAQWAVVQTRIAELTALPLRTVTPIPIRPTITPAPWPTGITNGPNSLPSEFYIVRNGWQYNLSDIHYIVYAGAIRSDPEQGFITVSTINLVTNIGTSQTDYMTPTKAGAIQVTGAEGSRLTLEAADGTRFYFDVATRQWVNP
jgi:hypothetical protein